MKIVQQNYGVKIAVETLRICLNKNIRNTVSNLEIDINEIELGVFIQTKCKVKNFYDIINQAFLTSAFGLLNSNVIVYLKQVIQSRDMNFG